MGDDVGDVFVSCWAPFKLRRCLVDLAAAFKAARKDSLGTKRDNLGVVNPNAYLVMISGVLFEGSQPLKDPPAACFGADPQLVGMVCAFQVTLQVARPRQPFIHSVFATEAADVLLLLCRFLYF